MTKKIRCNRCDKQQPMASMRVLEISRIVSGKIILWYLLYLCKPCSNRTLRFVGEVAKREVLLPRKYGAHV